MDAAKSGIAKFVKDAGWASDARLFRLDPPLDDGDTSYEYVIVSGVVAMFSGSETYIFPARADGEAINMRELDGSFRGDIDHAKALRNAGYEIQ